MALEFMRAPWPTKRNTRTYLHTHVQGSSTANLPHKPQSFRSTSRRFDYSFLDKRGTFNAIPRRVQPQIIIISISALPRITRDKRAIVFMSQQKRTINATPACFRAASIGLMRFFARPTAEFSRLMEERGKAPSWPAPATGCRSIRDRVCT